MEAVNSLCVGRGHHIFRGSLRVPVESRCEEEAVIESGHNRLLMTELAASTLGVAITVAIGILLFIMASGYSYDIGIGFLSCMAALLIDALVAIYFFLVRFVHWCWLTPITFTSG